MAAVIGLDLQPAAMAKIDNAVYAQSAEYDDVDDYYYVEDKHGRDDDGPGGEHERLRPRLMVPEVAIEPAPKSTRPIPSRKGGAGSS